MSLYHLGSLTTFAYLAFLVATIIASKFVFIPLLKDIVRDTKGWKVGVGLFLASTGWLIFIAGMALNVFKYLFNFGV